MIVWRFISILHAESDLSTFHYNAYDRMVVAVERKFACDHLDLRSR